MCDVDANVFMLYFGRRWCKERSNDIQVFHLPLLEIGIHHTIRETFTTDTNTFEHTVTGELMHDQMRIDNTLKRRSREKQELATKIRIEKVSC